MTAAAESKVVAAVVSWSPTGTQTVQYSGQDRDLVERDADAAHARIDPWLRGPVPVTFRRASDGLYVACVTQYGAD